MITVIYSSIDNVRIRRRFASLAGAQNFAFHWVGERPEIGSTYAVSGDGVGKIEVIGATLAELFPQTVEDTFLDEQAAYEQAEREWRALERQREIAEIHASAAEFAELTRVPRDPACRCSDEQLIHVGCECDRGSDFLRRSEGPQEAQDDDMPW